MVRFTTHHTCRVRRTQFFDHRFVAMAHRGGASSGLENTAAAFDRAVALGYRYLETDVHATRDNVVVAFHDASLDRITDRRGLIADLSWHDVASARVDGGTAGSASIMRLEELLERYRDARINIDIKASPAIEPLIEVLGRTDAWDRVCVTSFGARRLHRFRRLVPRPVATSMSWPGVAWHTWGLPGLVSGPGQALQIPMTAGRQQLVTERLIRRAHQAGTAVHVWTINDRPTMSDLIDLGVDGLVTDELETLKIELIARDLWES